MGQGTKFKTGLLTTCVLACGFAPLMVVGAHVARAQEALPTTSPSSSGVPPRGQTPAQAIPPDVSRGATENIIVKAQRRLLKEKNSPSAVTELGERQIQQVGISGSPATLLRQAPSINVYQQGIGDSAPELTIRGARGLETASTWTTCPRRIFWRQARSRSKTTSVASSRLGQISGVSIYPGIAYPDKNTFGTIGGTIAYDCKRPTNDFYVDVFGGVGSFQTYTEGFEVNSGSLDGPLGTGDNAPKILLNYKNLQTLGFIDYTRQP